MLWDVMKKIKARKCKKEACVKSERTIENVLPSNAGVNERVHVCGCSTVDYHSSVDNI